MPIKSFRGLLTDGAVETISLHTNNGSVGYRIKKMELMPNKPGDGVSSEHIVQVFSISQTTASNEIDFDDQTLLAAGFVSNSVNAYLYPVTSSIVFDNTTFNQDIHITHVDHAGSSAVNYYIELEQIKLDLNENTVATLKDIRNIKSQ